MAESWLKLGEVGWDKTGGLMGFIRISIQSRTLKPAIYKADEDASIFIRPEN